MKNVMRSAVYVDKGKVEIQTFEKPICDPDKILVRIEACALCTYEQRLYSGVLNTNFPTIVGHEVAGVIEEVGEDLKAYWKPNEKVVVGNMFGCGNCFFCQSQESQSCIVYDDNKKLPGQPYYGTGGMSEFMMQPSRNVFRYYHVTPQEAALIEPLACVVQSVESVNPQLGDFCVIIGAGIMGQLHTQLCVKKGCCVIVIDMNEERLNMAQSFGAKYVINPEKEDATKRIHEITHGNMAQCVFDTTPIANVIEQAYNYVGRTGVIMIYSGIYPNKPISINPHWLHKSGVTLKGTANANQSDFMRSSALISNGMIDVKPLISEVYSINDVNDALKSACKGDKYRNVLVMDFDQKEGN